MRDKQGPVIPGPGNIPAADGCITLDVEAFDETNRLYRPVGDDLTIRLDDDQAASVGIVTTIGTIALATEQDKWRAKALGFAC